MNFELFKSYKIGDELRIIMSNGDEHFVNIYRYWEPIFYSECLLHEIIYDNQKYSLIYNIEKKKLYFTCEDYSNIVHNSDDGEEYRVNHIERVQQNYYFLK
jgi:hypothetical protein